MNALQILLAELRLWLMPLERAATDARYRRHLERLLFRGDGRRLSADSLGGLSFDMPTFDDQDPVALVEDLLGLVNSIRDFRALIEVVTLELPDLLTSLWLEYYHPIVARCLELATFYDPLPPPGGQRLRWGQFETLANDGLGMFAREYLDAEEFTPEDAEAYADQVSRRLFPRVAGLLQALGVKAVFGLSPTTVARYRRELGDGDVAAFGRMLFTSIQGPLSGPRTGEGPTIGGSVTLGLGLEPFEGGGARPLTVALAPSGAIQLSLRRGHWLFETELEAAGGVIRIPPEGPVGWTGGGDVGAALSVGGARLSLPGHPALQIGNPDGTRFEIGRIGAVVVGAVTGDGLGGEVGFDITDGAIVIVPRGGFIEKVLPPEGLRITFDFGLRVSSTRGVSFSGGVGLEWRLPLHKQLGPLVLQQLTLSLQASAEGPPLRIGVGASLSLTLGPLMVSVEDIGVRFALNEGDRGLEPTFGFQAPRGLGLAIDAKAVKGGGFLSFDPGAGRYSGVLQLVVRDTIEISALTLVETKLPEGGYSLMAAIYAGFPGIPLGMGFSLTGIGGMLALHRRIDSEAMIRAVVEHRLDALLFPQGDLVAQAPALFATLRELFPAAQGRFVFGPYIRIEWAKILEAEIGLLFELPAPVKVVLVGLAWVRLPKSKPILELNLQVLGLLDIEGQFFHLQGQLYDSRLLFLQLSGSFLIHLGWGNPRRFILSVGGFHPSWIRPAGVLGLNEMEKLRVSVVSNSVLDVSLSAYFAVTSNSLQFGGRLDLSLDLRVVSIRGWLAFDALFQWNPVAFEVSVDAGLEVKIRRFTLASVRVIGALSGPNPWRLRGKLKISILFIRIKVSFDKTFGQTAPVVIESARMPRALLQAALADADAWSAAAPKRIPARLRELPRHVADPHATLRFEQHQVPLDTPIARADGQALDQAHRFSADAPDTVDNDFALGALQPWTDATRLARPGYQARPAGARWSETGAVAGASAARSLTLEIARRAQGDAVPPSHHPIDAAIDMPPLSTLLATG